jgi:hypothetical protein
LTSHINRWFSKVWNWRLANCHNYIALFLIRPLWFLINQSIAKAGIGQPQFDGDAQFPRQLRACT